MINVTRTYLPSIDEYQALLRQIWDNGWLTNGGQFEQDLADNLKEYFDVPNLELVANGMLALQLAIRALGLKGEVITTPFSYVATANAIVWEGCQPVFVDVDENSFCISPDLIESAITEHTSAIIATHVYGIPCDVEKIASLAAKYNLKVIYDAAHCFGVSLHGKSILMHGDISALSFHATKLFHTAEGGAVVCRDVSVNERIHSMKKFGHLGEDRYLEIGTNAKLSELHAAMGLCVLPKVGEIIARRREVSIWYDDLIASLGLHLRRPIMPPGLEYNYSYYPVVFESHESMMNARSRLIENGIMPRRYFHPSLNTLSFLQPFGYRSCSVSESLAERVLSLPLYVGLEQSQVARIVHVIADAVQ